ncbi:MAG: L-rhamnose mutarotase [Rhizobium sp.]|nr:L-rhamnose mutarotase [Rhizobium sp.]
MITKGPGEAVLFIYRLKPGMGDEYDRAHRAVWPDILDLLDDAGIYDYQIWRRGDLVVSRMRTRHGYDHAAAVTGASEVQKRWTASLGHVFAEIADANGAPLWLDKVFSHRVIAGDNPS